MDRKKKKEMKNTTLFVELLRRMKTMVRVTMMNGMKMKIVTAGMKVNKLRSVLLSTVKEWKT